jgi:lysophospholipid acyltransferase (LPLAT)-like uncharacterized protein
LERFLKKYILSYVIWFLYELLWRTWRITYDEPTDFKNLIKNKSPIILSHWHGDELVLISTVRRYNVATMSSKSDDGEMMSIVINLLGGKTSRGSSSKGAVAGLKGLIKIVKDGHSISFAVDGPKGPLHIVKPGVFEFSRLVSAPIYAAGVHAGTSWKFPKAWNKTFLPKPFARITIVWRKVFDPISRDLDPRDQALADKLADALRNAQGQALQKNCDA